MLASLVYSFPSLLFIFLCLVVLLLVAEPSSTNETTLSRENVFENLTNNIETRLTGK